ARPTAMKRREFLGGVIGGAVLLPLARRRALAAETFEVVRSEAEWRKLLSPEQYAVLREEDTERAHSSPLVGEKREGTYLCAGCDLALFASATKYDSKTGWPSFWAPLENAIATREEGIQYFYPRTEVHCRRCGGHLGHIEKDGPPPTGLRYCINGAALRFASANAIADPPGASRERATFAAGCFWHVEAAFRKVPGVLEVVSGYTGGTRENPTYEEVCADTTGHAEAVEIEFDPRVTSYDRLLEVFWSEHDPTTLNRQGWDVGSQYRSAIFFHSPEQKRAAEASKERLEMSGRHENPIVTQILPAEKFHRAEEKHQRYFEKHPEEEHGRAARP
ncbi:MAG: bifunctional methionine sulfoxide reductase B/A protein, partial [Candidatus Binatia bacterium]